MNKLTKQDEIAKQFRATHKDFLVPGRYYWKRIHDTLVADADEAGNLTWRQWGNCYPPESAVVL